MATGSGLAQRLAMGRVALFGWLSLPGRFHAAIMAKGPNDGVLVDLQHGLMDYSQTLEMIAAIHAAGKPAIARVPVGDVGLLGRLADAGADGLIMPMVESAEQARAAVAQVKYPPVGQRSWGPYLALQESGMGAGDYLKHANESVRFFPMIETRRGHAALDEILAVPGVDGIFVGPADLSISISNGAGADVFAPEPFKVASDIAARCKARGVPCGIYAGSPGDALKLAAAGFSFITLGIDVGMYADGIAQSFTRARGN